MIKKKKKKDGKHRWSRGMIVAFQAADTGSSPVRCIFFCM